ncbi:MAG: PPC domain-containing protein, partial [Gemmataceae bacterium]
MLRTRTALASLFGVWGMAMVAFAVDPHLNAIQPRGGQRGTDVVCTLQGSNLNDVLEVAPYYPGTSVVKTTVLNKDTLQVTLKIAPDCRLGEHAFRVRTSAGYSELRSFWIGALTVVDEKEPNTQFDTPQVVALNSTIHGTVDNEDVDYYQVDCKKGQRLSVEVEGMRLGGTFFDPFVAILDSRRFELAFGDDSPNTGQDGGCSVVIPADGKYIVQIRESSYGGNGGCQYRLHIGNFPRPTAVIPAGGKPGEEIEFRFLGDPAGEIKQKIKLPGGNDPNLRVYATTAEGSHPAGLKVRVADLPNIVETPTANTPAGATPGTAPGAFHGIISKPGESKHFRFPVKKGQVFEVQCHARRLGSILDPVVHVATYVNGAAAQYLTGNDDSAGPDSVLRYTAPADGESIVWLHDHLQKGGPDFAFRIEVMPVVPTTTTTFPKVDGNNVSNQDRQTINVPRGNRTAILAQVNRADWGGPATVGFDALPPGVTLTTEPCDPGLGTVPMVFEAKADAPLGGVLTPLRANPTDPKTPYTSRTELDVNFNIGLNNTPFHRLLVDRMAIATTESLPFKVDVVEPKIPLVQNGSYNLKVVATRTNGFTGPITLYPLFTPPNVGITGATTIPEKV